MVVPVLMRSCQVSEKPKNGPEIAHATTMATHARKVIGLPAMWAIRLAKRAKSWSMVLQVVMRFAAKVDRIGGARASAGAAEVAQVKPRCSSVRAVAFQRSRHAGRTLPESDLSDTAGTNRVVDSGSLRSPRRLAVNLSPARAAGLFFAWGIVPARPSCSGPGVEKLPLENGEAPPIFTSVGNWSTEKEVMQ